LSEALARYLEMHRPSLLGEDGDQTTQAFWIGKGGNPMGASAIAFQVRHRTEVELGVEINIHSFRHMAATNVANEDPQSLALASAVLGHASPKTTEAHYNRATTVSAVERYQDHLKLLRRRRRRPPPDDETLPMF
jgi:integrase